MARHQPLPGLDDVLPGEIDVEVLLLALDQHAEELSSVLGAGDRRIERKLVDRDRGPRVAAERVAQHLREQRAWVGHILRESAHAHGCECHKHGGGHALARDIAYQHEEAPVRGQP